MSTQGSHSIIHALNLELNGDWDGAHRLVQDIPSREAARVHAYLHRIEGDLGNAQYWYSRAGESMPEVSLDEERKLLFDRFNQ